MMHNKKKTGQLLRFYENKVIPPNNTLTRVSLDILLNNSSLSFCKHHEYRVLMHEESAFFNIDSRAENNYNALVEVLSE